jgi:hypothetical protein
MARCDEAHAQFDPLVDGEVRIGTLPGTTRVRGKVAWYVHQGPYNGLPDVWREFPQRAARHFRGLPDGPPGEVFLCLPGEHDPERMLTILYLPIP